MTDTNHPGRVDAAGPPETQVRRLLVRARRKLRLVRAVEAAAVAATAGALLAAATLLVGWLTDVTGLSSSAYLGAGRYVPLVLIPLAAAAAATVGLLRPIDLRQAGRRLDLRAHLRDRLATAAELIESSQAEAPVVRTVCAQALRAAERADALNVPLWSRTRATAAALGLSLLLVGALLPVAAAAGRRGPAEVASALGRMTPQQREQLAEAIRRLASQAGLEETNPEVARAADAALDSDAERLEPALVELRRAGVDTSALLRREPEPDEPARADTAPDAPLTDAESPAEPDPPAVRVYSPASPDSGDATESYTRAWDRAQAQAAGALASGRIPPRYRMLVRRYFAGD
ncbi:MAG: hypothetical protein ACP5HU_11055 [Phycisphaerae bacterium]